MPEYPPSISRIILIKLRENVVGTFAGVLAEMLEPADLDTPVIIDFSVVTSIDGYGINVIADTLARGINLQMVGVRSRVRRMIRQARTISETQFADTIEAALAILEAQYSVPEAPDAERRRHRRIRAHIPVEIVMNLEGHRVSADGIIKDISRGGVYIELSHGPIETADDDIEADSELDLQFSLPDITYPVLLQTNSVHSENRAATLYCGVKFGELTYLDEDAIRVFLYRHDPDRRAGSA